MDHFELVSPYKPTGDQPVAIKTLTEGIQNGLKEQVLLREFLYPLTDSFEIYKLFPPLLILFLINILQIINSHIHTQGVEPQPTMIHNIWTGNLENFFTGFSGIIVPISIGITCPIQDLIGKGFSCRRKTADLFIKFFKDVFFSSPLKAIIGVV